MFTRLLINEESNENYKLNYKKIVKVNKIIRECNNK